MNAEFLDERLPNGKLVVMEAGHFVWEEQAGQYAALVADWVTDGYRAAAARERRGHGVPSNRRR